jgi:hypothetical protein
MKKRTMNELRQEKEYQNCTGDVKGHASVALKEIKASKNLFEHEAVDKAVDQIVETLQPEIFDAIFEDEWFEFYHENHGKIMHKLLQNLK